MTLSITLLCPYAGRRILSVTFNEGKSAASVCRQVAALFTDMLRNFYLVKNRKIAKNSITTKTGEKVSTDFNPYHLNIFNVCLTKFIIN